MSLHVGNDDSDPVAVTNVWVGDDTSTPRALEQVWVGDTKGFPRLVWQKTVLPILTVTPTAWNRVDVAWTPAAWDATYKLKRGSTTVYQGSGFSYIDTGVTGGKTYTYTLESQIPPGLTNSVSAQVTTPAQPTQQKVVTLSPSSAGSYYGNNTRRNTGGPFYSGNYTFGSNGRQKSAFCFNIPSDLRNCVSVDKVEFKVQNDHWYNTPGIQYIAVTHTQAAGSTFPGSTGVFGGRTTSRDAWWGNADGDRFIDITNAQIPSPPSLATTVAENFRTKGAWGICLVPPNDNIGYYGYWRAAGVQLRLTYTVATG
jgi:hypothetical protein